MPKPFVIKEVSFPLGQAVASNMTITPKIYVDSGTSSKTLRVLNTTNFPSSDWRYCDYTTPANGSANFFLELRWSGTALCTVAMPITIVGEYKE